MKYIRDSRGRVGRVLSETRVEYAYGPGQYPRGSVETLDESAGEDLLREQRRVMWEHITRLQSLALSVARACVAKFAQENSYAERKQLTDQLVADLSVQVIGYASTTWRPKDASLRVYVSRVLTHAYTKELQKRFSAREVNFDTLENLLVSEQASVETELFAQDELNNLGLSSDEIDLLRMRFESKLTLSQIAHELGVSSKYTVMCRIQKILDNVRRRSNY